MEFKQVNFEVQNEGEGSTIVGYGSVYGNVDLGGDIVLPGAFSKSIASGQRSIKMLWQHDAHKPIGKWNIVADDEKGIRVEGVFAQTIRGQEAKELVKMGAIDGLSIGYKVIEADYDNNGNRLIKEAELWEISVVTFPMNESATITGIKAADMLTKTGLERTLRAAGYSRSQAKGITAKGFDALLEENLRKADENSEEENTINKDVDDSEQKLIEEAELKAKELADIEAKQINELKDYINKTYKV